VNFLPQVAELAEFLASEQCVSRREVPPMAVGFLGRRGRGNSLRCGWQQPTVDDEEVLSGWWLLAGGWNSEQFPREKSDIGTWGGFRGASRCGLRGLARYGASGGHSEGQVVEPFSAPTLLRYREAAQK
jgi:hypothetical protein